MSTIVIIVAIGLAALGLVAAIANKWQGQETPSAPPTVPPSECGSCDGHSSKCEQECMLEASVKAIEYFDDEELDAFAGRPGDSYSDEEAEMFSEVLYTMRPEEAAAWSRSLTLRGITVPHQIRDELLLMVGESFTPSPMQ